MIFYIVAKVGLICIMYKKGNKITFCKFFYLPLVSMVINDSKVGGNNPLANGLQFKVVKAPAPVADKPVYLEATGYTKVFHDYPGLKDKIYKLSNSARQLFDYILLHLDSGCDWIELNRAHICSAAVYNIKAPKTYRDAVAELEMACIICHHAKLKDVYWVNPSFIFCGSRPNKYPEKMIVKK